MAGRYSVLRVFRKEMLVWTEAGGFCLLQASVLCSLLGLDNPEKFTGGLVHLARLEGEAGVGRD